MEGGRRGGLLYSEDFTDSIAKGGGQARQLPKGVPASPVQSAAAGEGTFQGSPDTFLVFGKKGSHLSLSGADGAFSAVLEGRASRSRIPVWLMYVLRAKSMGALEERRGVDPEPSEVAAGRGGAGHCFSVLTVPRRRPRGQCGRGCPGGGWKSQVGRSG